jgi:hypothetical protein
MPAPRARKGIDIPRSPVLPYRDLPESCRTATPAAASGRWGVLQLAERSPHLRRLIEGAQTLK